ncbi:MAG: glycerophosphodiester phosphodiesterase family protein [Myxococcota bacterium]
MYWLPRSHTIAVAHRGFSSRAPENTLVAFREAIQAGATHVECDVRANKNGTPYVLHDATLARTASHPAALADLSDADVAGLDAGAWKDPRYAGEPVPRLDALLRLLAEHNVSLALELKVAGIERTVLDMIRDTDYPTRHVTFFAFEYEVLRTLRHEDPELHCTYLVDRIRDDGAWVGAVARARDDGMRAIGPGAHLVDERRIEVAQSAGLSVFVWTVDDAAAMQQLSVWGVDAIMSNDIALAQQTLEPSA